ncbi:MAG: discoidin domain-containing protein [Candidatus Omnitrophica bacterium]|nr:discoidin domain-containing protein [Candidatus Omnitrophota bacterium]
MIKRLRLIFALAVLISGLGLTYTCPAFADSQIGAFIADWEKDATFPWHGEQGIINFEEVIGRKTACIKIYKRIVDEFPYAECIAVNSHGTADSPTAPYIDIHPSTNDSDDIPHLLQIINGDFDAYIQKWAEDIKEYGKPLWICFDGEMNGDWHNGSGAANGGGATDAYGDPTKPDGPEVYVDAWRHMHDIFTSIGADNAAWVWAVNNSDWPREEWNKFENYYPGDGYVDWLGVDGYNWNRVEYAGWQTFQQVFDNKDDEYSNSFDRLRGISVEKPIIIAEFGCAHKRKAKKEWVQNAFDLLKTDYPFVECFIWFDMNKEENWLIDSDGSRIPRIALSDSYFTSAGDPGTPAINTDDVENLALDKSTTASSVETNSAHVPSNAVDGNYLTRWSSHNSDPQWIAVDLGAFCDISKVILNWETAYAKSYAIQISDDGSYWDDAYVTTAGDGGVDIIPLAANTRHVRMYGTERYNTAWGYSLFELGVYGTRAESAEYMHIQSIDMSVRAKRKGTFATAEVKIVDAGGAAVSGATVSGQWSGLTQDSDSTVTDSFGIASCDSNKTNTASGTFTFTVNSVFKEEWTYDSAADLEKSDSINIGQ